VRRLLLLVLVGCSAFSLSVRAWQFAAAEPQVAQPAKVGNGVIVGQVVDAATGRPVPGAIVSAGVHVFDEATVGIPFASQRRVIVGATGRFVFTGVTPGTVSISVTAAGYLTSGYGQRGPRGMQRTLLLTDGVRPDPITIQLWKPAVIEGRLVDEAGEPIVRATVRGLRRDWARGRPAFSSYASDTTDDRGVFRLSRLIPGDWVLVMPATYQTLPNSVREEFRRQSSQGSQAAQEFDRAMRSSGAPSANTPGERVGPFTVTTPAGLEGWRTTDDGEGVLVYAPVYYPAPGADGFEVLTLASGEERTGIELQAVPTRAVSISGMVMGPDGPAARMGVRLTPVALSGLTPPATFETARTSTDASGVFTFLGVPAGDYEVTATLIPVPGFTGVTTVVSGAGATMLTATAMGPPVAPTESTLSATGRVSVGNRDLAGLTLVLAVGPRVSGTAEFSGTATQPTPEQLQRASVTLQSVASGQMATALTRFDSEGRFTTMGYPPGRYVVTASSPAPGWSMQSAMLGGRDISVEPITLEDRDISGVVVTFSDQRTEISGAVIPTTGSDTDATVVVFPSDVATWARNGMNPRQVRAVRTNSVGRYLAAGLPAGSYLVTALSSDVEVEMGHAAFFEALVPLSTLVVVSHGERRTMDVRARPAREDDSEPEQGSGPWVPDTIEPQGQVPVRDVVTTTVGTSSISGVVTLDDDARTPVRRARVRLTGSAGTVSIVTATDNEGRFVFGDLPAVRYSLSADRAGFVTGYYGASKPGRGPGAPLALADGQHLTGVSITMARGAVITGRIVDEFGLPVQGAMTAPMEFRTVNGVRTLTGRGPLFGVATTDDRGVYRLFGLPEGEFVVAVAPMAGQGALRSVTDAELAWAERPSASTEAAPPEGPTVGVAPFYYPGTADPAQAVPIRVQVGEERVGLDFVARYVRTATVSGRVEMPDGTAPRTVQMNLFAEGRYSGLPASSSSLVRVNPDGTFSGPSVHPGRYSLIARAAASSPTTESPAGGRGAAPAMSLWAMREIDITGDDVTGLIVTLAPGMTISGRVVFDGHHTPVPTDARGYSVRVVPVETSGVGVGVPVPQVNPDGTFVIEGAAPGTYRISVGMPTRTGSLPTWTVQRIMHEGRDVADSTFDVHPGTDVTGLEVVLIDRVTEVSGTVTDRQGKPVTDYSVLLLPTDPSAWVTGTRRRPAPQRPDSTGRFRFIDLPAGEYYLAVLTEFEPNELADTAFLESLLPAAIKFTLAEGERKVQDVTLAGG
jgi:protocatechuate 3,4-dioxygenase beta subunit